MARLGLRSHLSGSVPVSIAVHVVVLLLLFVVPLLDITLPSPFAPLRGFVMAKPLPPPPAPAPARAVSPRPSTNDGAAPTVAPKSIVPEPIAPPSIAIGSTAEGGPPTGLVVDGSVTLPSSVPSPAPAEPPRPAAPVRAAQLPELPRKIVDVHPTYPDLARMARVEGTVVLEAILDPAGRVTQLRVIKSIPLLDQAAMDAVKQWRYTPSMYGGRAVSVLMTITIRFTLSQLL